jgi:replicative DNA helicase
VNPEMPHSLDAERALLGGLLINKNALIRIPKITVDHFYFKAHAIIFDAVSLASSRDSSYEFVARNRRIPPGIGASFLAELIEATPTAANIVSHAKIVDNKYQQRRAMIKATEIFERIAQANGNLTELLTAGIDTFSDIIASKHGVVSTEEATDEAVEYIRRIKESAGGGPHVGRELPKLNNVLLGLQPGYYVIGGYPFHGKTSLANQISANLNVRNAYFTAEGRESDIVRMRILSELGETIYSIKHCDWPEIIQAAQIASSKKTAIYKATKLKEITSIIHLEVKTHQCQAVFVDYAQRIHTNYPGKMREQNVHKSHVLSNLATDLGIAVVVLSQLNDDGAFKESRAYYEDADVSIKIKIPDENDKEKRQIVVDKNRLTGQLMTIDCRLDKRSRRFTETHRAQDDNQNYPYKD